MKMCIRMGITVLKIVIWGYKSSVLWSQITFYGDHETKDLLPKMTVLKSHPLNLNP